jgi:chromosome segregation protein
MLKALELIGFKSFADKTRFEFPRGITVVVGPNGSGKSNVVDAIKWVLGEQSVKSLRGKEMADVIFNGSASRKPVNSAECTLTFDNSSKLLSIDTPEVQITRRVYRSGEGEYLINRQPCRLRDIRDLFAGTGVATEAYSVIEQGKVDVMLQASPRDRRMIFEEAAGISRFKAKKIEAHRRLERVDQNLLRLQDIVDEVENRLRTIRNQATKARKYREYTERLQSLRTQVGLADWRKYSSRLETLEAELTTARDDAAGAQAELESIEARALAVDVAIGDCDAAMRQAEAAVSGYRERIAAHETTIDHQRKQVAALEQEIAHHRQHTNTLQLRSGDLESQIAQLETRLTSVTTEHAAILDRAAAAEGQLAVASQGYEQVRTAFAQRSNTHREHLRQSAELGKTASALETRLANLQSTRQQTQQQIAELAATIEAQTAELSQRDAASHAALTELETCTAEHAALADRCAQLRHDAETTAKQLAALREQRSAVGERVAVLEELEKRNEGVSAGAKELLALAREAETGPLTRIRGMVADVFNVEIETARIIEVALGDLAQHLVASNSLPLIELLQQTDVRFTGRVGLLRLDLPPQPSPADELDLNDQPGVLGRADRFVETTPEFAPLARRLLGHTWIVNTLDDALRLQAGPGRHASYVTLAGEHVCADGTMQLGPRPTGIGIITRRSELRALRHQLHQLDTDTDSATDRLQLLTSELQQTEAALAQLATQHQRLAAVAAEQRLAASNLTEQLRQTTARHQQLADQANQLESQRAETQQRQTQVAAQLEATELAAKQLEQQLADDTVQLTELDTQRQKHSATASKARIELARYEQQLADLALQRTQLENDRTERGRTLQETRDQLDRSLARLRAAEQQILSATSACAELYLHKEQSAAQSTAQATVRAQHHVEKQQLTQDMQRLRNRLRKVESQVRVKELAAGEARLECNALVERLRDDFGIDLHALQHEPTGEEIDQRDEVEREIADLRGKLQQMGSVNLEALDELDELETRFASLSGQHQDLVSAKQALEQIIHKINADSRRLFAETLDVVRGHFQQLFRKLFGGGQADIVLDEGVDILESGIEIVARPPGKEPRNISLLSGGEKTLTCVALLLSIFRSKPSPFCVLDEVDAALDEANIDRFVSVLHEFLSWTQFIVVTHSKKTMTTATTLYGVTMQESGISKRVSVRFEDVSDNGEIVNYREVDDQKTDDETQAA